VKFSNGVSANTHKEFALEILMTMAPILDEGVSSLSFRLEGVEQVFPYEYIRELLGFQKGAPEQVDVHGGTLEGFWRMIAGESNQQRNSIRNPIIRVFHSWMCKRILGRMKETKITDMKVNWLYSALIARQPVDPTHLMINQWCCEATSGSGDIGSGCYLAMLAIFSRPGIPRNLDHLLVGTSLGFDYMKHGKYISGDERGGFKLVKVNLPLLDARLRLFLGERRLVRGRTSSAGKKEQERKDSRRRFFHIQRRRCTTKLCAAIWKDSGTAKLLRWCTNASMGEWCSHAPTKFCGTQHSLCRAICTPSSTTTKCGHHWRVHCKKHAK
jgi:hypothetical protein